MLGMYVASQPLRTTKLCINYLYVHRSGVWQGSSGDNCNTWMSSASSNTGRGSVIRDSGPVQKQSSIPCDRAMAVLCVLSAA